ncbi:MAG TPA: hypothetical protein VK835_04475 [Bacteroidia bacterium]|jgi:hypothetical protein|nr:hypothetical protein [Bacteroidia bacterium]
MHEKIYTSTNPKLTNSKKTAVVLLIILVGTLFYFAPSRYSKLVDHRISFVVALLATSLMLALFFYPEKPIQCF